MAVGTRMTAITQPPLGKQATKPTTTPTAKPATKRPLYYPTGDGKPMAESLLHRDQMFYATSALLLHFASRPDVHVSGNDFVYYVEGSPKIRVSPDCYVVMGVPRRRRLSYKVWEEKGVTPTVIFEFTSRKTHKEDTFVKRPLYEKVLRAAEYFQFDPTGDYLTPRLQGQRLQEGVYQAIELRDNRMFSRQLGLELVIEGETLRFYDPVKGEWLLTYEQAEVGRRQEAERADSEAQRAAIADERAASEAERANIEADLAASATERAESEQRRADSEKQRADSEAEHAESEKRRAEAAEAELTRLRAELEALRRQNP